MPKSKTPRTLHEKVFKWIENEMPGRPAHSETRSNMERQRLYRIRQVALKEMRDLTKLVELLPEDQLKHIFNHENLKDLFRVLFTLPELDEKTLKERRQRLLPLCYGIIACLDNPSFAMRFAPEIYRIIIKEKGPVPGVRTVYYRSQLQE